MPLTVTQTLKRKIDVVGFLAKLAPSSPILGAIVAAIRGSMERPASFLQKWPGYGADVVMTMIGVERNPVQKVPAIVKNQPHSER